MPSQGSAVDELIKLLSENREILLGSAVISVMWWVAFSMGYELGVLSTLELHKSQL